MYAALERTVADRRPLGPVQTSMLAYKPPAYVWGKNYAWCVPNLPRRA